MMNFQTPHFTFWSVVFTALGASFFWFKSTHLEVKAWAMSDMVRRFIKNNNARYVVEYLLFVTIGTVVAIAFVEPSNVPQAITAGIAWTSTLGYVTGEKQSPKRSSR